MKRHTAVSLAATFTLLCCSILPVGAYDMGSPEEPLRLSAGLSHTVYVDETGTLWAWGSNQAGQLGTETQETSTDLEGNPIPYASQPLAVMEDVVSASAGADFTVALKADGSLWTWGGNDEGQLGTGTTEGSATPVQVLDQVTAVVAGTTTWPPSAPTAPSGPGGTTSTASWGTAPTPAAPPRPR